MEGAVGFRGALSSQAGADGHTGSAAVPGATLFLSSTMATVSKNTKIMRRGEKGSGV